MLLAGGISLGSSNMLRAICFVTRRGLSISPSEITTIDIAGAYFGNFR